MTFNGFHKPQNYSAFDVFSILCSGHIADNMPQEDFKSYFIGKSALHLVCLASDMLEELNQWKRRGVPSIRVSALKAMFGGFLNDEMVIVNVNGGPHVTYMGLV